MSSKYSHRMRIDSHPSLPLDPDAVRPGAYKWPPHLTFSLQAIVFIGGFLGTLARYGVSILLPVSTNGFPTATFVVNIIGAFLLGLLLQALFHHGPDEGKTRLVRLGIGTGFIGAFTTYSSFVVEANLLVVHNQPVMGLLYAIITVISGLLLSMFGIYIATSHNKSKRSTS